MNFYTVFLTQGRHRSRKNSDHYTSAKHLLMVGGRGRLCPPPTPPSPQAIFLDFGSLKCHSALTYFLQYQIPSCNDNGVTIKLHHHLENLANFHKTVKTRLDPLLQGCTLSYNKAILPFRICEKKEFRTTFCLAQQS